MTTRKELASFIINRLEQERDNIVASYQKSQGSIGYFFVDDIFPEAIALSIHSAFPRAEDTTLKKSIREHKHVAAQMNQYEPLLEEVIYAFQDERIVNFFKDVCQVSSLYPDENLYAGGISMMAKDNFFESTS